MTPRAVVFDLNATLAKTGRSSWGTRAPADLLEPGRAVDPTRWAWSPEVSDLPGLLIAQGCYVAIVTRAPRAYASTLIELLGIDTVDLLTDCDQSTRGREISTLLAKRGIHPSTAVYVGDEDEDRFVARRAGTNFRWASELKNGALKRAWVDQGEQLLDQWSQGFTGDAADDDVSCEVEPLRHMLRAGIPDPDDYLVRLDAVISKANPPLKATLCMQTLLARPGIAARRDLQLALLRSLPEGAGPCILREEQGLVGLRPAFLTKAEVRRDDDLCEAYINALGCMYPSNTRVLGSENYRPISVSYLRPYGAVPFGNRLQKIKDYGGPYGTRYRSRSNVEFGGLGIIADMMSTAVSQSVDVVVPIPSSPFSRSQPGEVSYRLAYLVAERCGRPYAELLQRRGDEFVVAHGGKGKSVLLLDDQVSEGDSIQRAVRALESAGHTVDDVVAFSSSRVQETEAQQTCPLAEVNLAQNLLCPCDRNSPHQS